MQGSDNPLKDPELQGSEIDFKLTMYRHLDRIGRLSSVVNPLQKIEIFGFEGAINTLKAFLTPYLTEEYKVVEKEIELKKIDLKIEISFPARQRYFNLLLDKLSALTQVMDAWGMLLKRYENEDINVSEEEIGE